MTDQERMISEHDEKMKQIQREADIRIAIVIAVLLSIIPLIAIALALLPPSTWTGGK